MLSEGAVKTRSIVGVSAGTTSAQSSCSLYSFSASRADHHHTTHLRSNSIEASLDFFQTASRMSGRAAHLTRISSTRRKI
jgi:hypothetical protein